jgi:hypothetical protein
MSRRVAENTPAKKGAQGTWGVEDLRKRPSPRTGGWTSFRALHYDDAVGNDVTVGASQADIPFNYWENGDATVFQPRTSVGGTPTLGTHAVQNVRLLAEGLYLIAWGVRFNDEFEGTVAQYVHDADPIFGYPEVTAHGAVELAAVAMSGGFLVQSFSRHYPLLDPFDSGSHIPELSFDASQNSGVNETVTTAWLELNYTASVVV